MCVKLKTRGYHYYTSVSINCPPHNCSNSSAVSSIKVKDYSYHTPYMVQDYIYITQKLSRVCGFYNDAHCGSLFYS